MTVIRAVKLLIMFTLFESARLHRPPEPQTCNDCNIKQFIPEFADKVKNTDLCVEYGNHKVICGEPINLTTIINVPKITYDLTGECNYATIVDITPDVLVEAPYVLYLVHNVPVQNLKDGFKGESEDVPLGVFLGNNHVGDYGARYLFSKTVTGGLFGDTRYLFLVYCQCNKIPKYKIPTLIRGVSRGYFNLKEYAKKMQLRNPKAVIYHTYEPTGIPLPKLLNKPNV